MRQKRAQKREENMPNIKPISDLRNYSDVLHDVAVGVIQTNHMGVIDESYCGDNDQWFMPVLAIRDTEIHVNDRTI